MKYTITAALIAIIYIVTISFPVFGQNDQAKRQAKAEKIETRIKSLGLGDRAIVSVKLYDGRSFKGYVREVRDDDFVVVDQTGTANTLLYSDISSISGKNMSTGAKIAIGVGIGAGATLLVLYLVFQHITRNN